MRYFDGIQWTEHVSDNGLQSVDSPLMPTVPQYSGGQEAGPYGQSTVSPNWNQSPNELPNYSNLQSDYGPVGGVYGNYGSQGVNVPIGGRVGSFGGKIERSIRLLRLSLEVTKKNEGLILVPIIAGVAQVVIYLLAGLFIYVTDQQFNGGGQYSNGFHLSILSYVVGFVATTIVAYIAVVARAVITERTMATLLGGKQSNSEALVKALNHSSQLFIFALMNVVVSLVTRLIREEFGVIGKILSSMMNIAWSVLTYFVVPIILFENLGASKAVKKSGQLFRSRWGEQLIGSGVIGLVLFLALLGVIGVSVILGAIFVPLGVLIAVIGIIMILTLNSIVTGVYHTALYHYAKSGQIALGFTPDDLGSAFTKRRKSKYFGGSRF